MKNSEEDLKKPSELTVKVIQPIANVGMMFFHAMLGALALVLVMGVTSSKNSMTDLKAAAAPLMELSKSGDIAGIEEHLAFTSAGDYTAGWLVYLATIHADANENEKEDLALRALSRAMGRLDGVELMNFLRVSMDNWRHYYELLSKDEKIAIMKCQFRLEKDFVSDFWRPDEGSEEQDQLSLRGVFYTVFPDQYSSDCELPTALRMLTTLVLDDQPEGL